MQLAVGTSGGFVALFDLRSQRPLLTKDHMYGSRIVDVKFHGGGGGGGGEGGGGGGANAGPQRRVISADTRIIKIWDVNTGENFTSVEPPAGDINDVCVWPGCGLLLAGCDAPKVAAYFVPALGPAPRWCSFLEGLTEELEEGPAAVYDDYRFVTRSDLGRLGLEHLVGTPALRAYMHGFFMDARLYARAKAELDPFAYETYRAARVAKKLEEERGARISLLRRAPRVNAELAAKLLEVRLRAAAAAAAAACAQA